MRLAKFLVDDPSFWLSGSDLLTDGGSMAMTHGRYLVPSAAKKAILFTKRVFLTITTTD
jgi:hypothetical protein